MCPHNTVSFHFFFGNINTTLNVREIQGTENEGNHQPRNKEVELCLDDEKKKKKIFEFGRTEN